jgi:hypothetical protein
MEIRYICITRSKTRPYDHATKHAIWYMAKLVVLAPGLIASGDRQERKSIAGTPLNSNPV